MSDPTAGLGNQQTLLGRSEPHPPGLVCMDDLIVIGLRIRTPQRQIKLTSTCYGSMASSRIATVLGQERKNIELKRRL
jgi:hypothetical protein